PARGGAPRLPLELHDLRLAGSATARQVVPRGARQGPEALRAAWDPRADLEPEEPARAPVGCARARLLVLRPDRRRGLRPLPAPAARLERGRLRRPAALDRTGARALPGRAREVAEGLPL